MENLFQPNTAAVMVTRLEKIGPDSRAAWGKMNVEQMLVHCRRALEVSLGDIRPPRSLMGRIFGKIAKKQILNEKPFKKNMPTDPNFLPKGPYSFAADKKFLQSLIMRFSTADAAAIAARPHPFFGRLSSEEWGWLNWKHLDHHFRQFGA
jgi:hypothetical protein